MPLTRNRWIALKRDDYIANIPDRCSLEYRDGDVVTRIYTLTFEEAQNIAFLLNKSAFPPQIFDASMDHA